MPETFYGRHSDEEIRKFVDRHVHKAEFNRNQGFFSTLLTFGFGKKTVYTTVYDAKGMMEKSRVPSIFRHEKYEPPVEEGKFTTDRKGRKHRVR
jgi:hypothetical protein